jgi:N4-gp56 family major capsid protein
MAETTWDIQNFSDSGLASSKITEYIEKKLMKPEFFGDPGKFCVAGTLQKGSGDVIQWDRFRLLARPVSTADSATLSTPLDMTIDEVSATLDTYEAFTRFEKRGNFYLRHSLFQNALNLHRELFHRHGRLNIFDVLLASTNTYYGGGQASRDALTINDNDVGTRVRKAVSGFRNLGARGPDNRGRYPAFCNPDVIDILLDDSAFNQAESFQGRGMYNAEVKDWRGCTWYPTNLLPKITKLANVTIAAGATTGGALSNDTYYIITVKKNPLTGHAEGITTSQSITLSGGTATQIITVTTPASTTIDQDSNTAHVFDIYIGTTDAVASIYREITNQAAATAVSVDSLPTSGTTAPVAPASGVTVTPIVVMADEGCGNSSSKLYEYGRFQPTYVDGTPTISNDTGRIMSVGWNLDQKAVILNQKRNALIEIGYTP